MRRSLTFLIFLLTAASFAASSHASDAQFVHLAGHYSDADLVKGAACVFHAMVNRVSTGS